MGRLTKQHLSNKRLAGIKQLFRFDLSSATDGFPLSLQMEIVTQLCSMETAYAWVISGLGTNVFLAPANKRKDDPQYRSFLTGQPLGYLSSWPLFALSHHFIVWYCAEKVYRGTRFSKYALIGDDIVIGDMKVAEVYKDVMSQLGVNLSLSKSVISDCGGLEFAKKFRILDRELSPISIKMLRSARHPVAWMP